MSGESMISSRRIGKITVTSDVINKEKDILAEIFKLATPVEAKYNFDNDCVDYVMISDLFDEIGEAYMPPCYRCCVNRSGTGEITISFKKA